MKHSPLCFLVVMLLMVACKPTVPSQYIQPDEMEEILYDYHMTQAMAKFEGGDKYEFRRNLYFQAVLKKYGVTEAVFDSSLVYYYSHVDYLKDIYRKVGDRLSDNAKNLGAVVGDINRYSQYSNSGDTANIWNGASDVMLIPRPTKNRFVFTIQADSTFLVGDSFMFQFMSEYIYQSGMKDAVVCLAMKYEDDSIFQITSHVTASGIAQVRAPANKTLKLKEMKGFVYLNDGNDESDTRKMMFISQIQLIRFHDKNPVVHNETTERKDSVKTDSLQRGADSTRGDKDSVRSGVISRQGDGRLSIKRGTAPNGVAARKNSP